AEAQGRMPAAEAQLKEQLAAVEADIRKTEEALERYFLAFEAGTMDEHACASRVKAQSQRLASLTAHRGDLVAHATRQTVRPDDQHPYRRALASWVDQADASELKMLARAVIAGATVDGRGSIQVKLYAASQNEEANGLRAA
ncbi:MAG TPA: hypothetical protein VND96_11530, partial [Candidatus Micrarchaeaceae archaeon]|nr:hypothetical protein [Candidatus Micrarchaeaceae archaeon]